MTPALTREAVEKMAAGPEMDALVAEVVMSCKVIKQDFGGRAYGCGCEAAGVHGRNPLPPHSRHLVHATDCDDGEGLRCDDGGLAHYSRNIAAAWEVVEKMRLDLIQDDHGWMVGVFDGYTNVDGIVDGHLSDFATAPTAPLAICRAALLATL